MGGCGCGERREKIVKAITHTHETVRKIINRGRSAANQTPAPPRKDPKKPK